MSLTVTVFYDIPQLNLGLHLHKHADIRTTPHQDGGNGSSEHPLWKKITFFRARPTSQGGSSNQENGERMVLVDRTDQAGNEP